MAGFAMVAGPVLASEISADVLGRLPPADVVILGEIHDNPEHHRNQALAVAALMPSALVFEMLTPAQAGKTPPDRSEAEAMARAFAWQSSGWPEFSMYHPIFAAAPEARVYGGDLPPGEAQRAVSDGGRAGLWRRCSAVRVDDPACPRRSGGARGRAARRPLQRPAGVPAGGHGRRPAAAGCGAGPGRGSGAGRDGRPGCGHHRVGSRAGGPGHSRRSGSCCAAGACAVGRTDRSAGRRPTTL